MKTSISKTLCACLLLGVTNINGRAEEIYPWQLTSDSLLLFEGTTYRYTVDTPENEGLVSTLPTVMELKKKLVDAGVGTFNLLAVDGKEKTLGMPENGDCLLSYSGKRLPIGVRKGALPSVLKIDRDEFTIKTAGKLTLDFYAGQRSPMTTVIISVPEGIDVTLDNTKVNVIGRGEVLLRDLSKQSIGRTGTNYSYNRVGEVELQKIDKKGTLLIFKELDFRPSNGPDIRLCINGVVLPSKGTYTFGAEYKTSKPEILRSPVTTVTLKGVTTVTDFTRNTLRAFTYKKNWDLSFTSFHWTAPKDAKSVRLLQSEDMGKTWVPVKTEILPDDDFGAAYRLKPNQLYAFKLSVEGGDNQGDSNIAWYYSGLWDVKTLGVKGDAIADDTDALNKAIEKLNGIGGGILYFPAGTYNVRTVHLQSNVWLSLSTDAVIQALPGADAPEVTWFSDRAYRSGLSPTDPRPYADPENYLTKQDVGHTFFRNAMFSGERIDNVKIVGTGRITGNGNLVTTDKVMNNSPEKRADKMFSLKLCTNIEIGGWNINKDMWYDPQRDEPCYIEKDGQKNFDVSNMLHIDQAGHFVLLATGTDGIHVHDTYFAKHSSKNARDIYDFMACNDVTAINIYSRVSSDDIIKPGSDCSLGFTRPAHDYKVRNIVGDTNCNLFQIGSETADDIQDLYIDNIYVLGANKAGFSISTNDGGHIKNVYLNSGKTGPIHSRSVMRRTRAPFFISISNRGRVLGANVAPFVFKENGTIRKELLVTNSNIGEVENIIVKGVDIEEVYGGSSFRGDRWKAYNGSQNKATPIIAGFKLPDSENIEGGLTFRLPNGLHTGYIENVQFHDVNLLVKGGHPSEDAEACPPEIGVGRYNVGDLKIQPAFGFWARHVKGFVLDNCKINAENKDGRYAIVLDDVIGAEIKNLQVEKNVTDKENVKAIRSHNVVVE
ncbi:MULTISPECIES: glycosyl hydrolase family 28-related protein [Bacteroides]|uniref:glycosyl hydrolase family 28-related protein n=1 Tax=Bacteroides TaxID=816 RepID=UPI000E42E18D|nr:MULTISPECIES: glycosyl hydrolase family 28-related protein [Bacteroides]RGM47433.1 endopygalactorunase [Bacteroides sp. OM08-11]